MLPYVVATIVRLALVVFADWQDNNMAVKYTDIDYKVYTDAAIFVQKGGSPYDRTTYRYSPILAWMMLPNIMVHPVCGKIIFMLADLIVGVLIGKVLKLVGLPRKEVSFWVCSWLFNPLVINMSTRGSADSIVGVLILLTLYLLLCEKVLFASIAYGTVVHFRVYPAVYCLALFVCIGIQFSDLGNKEKLWMGIFSTYFKALQQQLIFAVGTAITFFSLGYTMYYIYGFQFVNDAFLHHFSRADTRHNFSMYFYDLYLRSSFETNDTDMVTNSITSRVLMGIISFIPQLSVLTVLSLSLPHPKKIYSTIVNTKSNTKLNTKLTSSNSIHESKIAIRNNRGISMCFTCFCITIAFVAFNKTKSFSFYPGRGLVLFILWLLSEWNWLFWAYQLEFKGKNTFLPIWFSGLIFFAAQILLLIELIRNHRGAKLKKE